MILQAFEQLSSSQAQHLVPLFEAVWPEQRHHPADIRWAFQTNPFGDGILLVSRDAGTAMITGARGSIPWLLRQANGVPAIIHQLHGTCVHPDYRRLGLFTQLNKAFLERFAANGGAAVFNVSVAASRAGYEKLGWTYLPGLRRYIYVAHPSAFIRALFGSQGRLRSTLQTVHNPNQPLTPWSEIEELAQIREQALAATHHTVINEAWLKWRYSHEEQGYRFAFQPDVGWCSYRLRQSSCLIEVLLGDVWLLRASRTSIRSLLKTIIRVEKPTVVSIMLTRGHPWRRWFLQAGFVPDWKGDLNFGVRPVSNSAQSLLDGSLWALTTADIDTF